MSFTISYEGRLGSLVRETAILAYPMSSIVILLYATGNVSREGFHSKPLAIANWNAGFVLPE